MVKGKLSFGARILRMGGMQKVFKTLFNVSEKEILLKASRCYLSTTAGPIAGFFFISTRKIAFCSERSLKVSCPNGETAKVHYKVRLKVLLVCQLQNYWKWPWLHLRSDLVSHSAGIDPTLENTDSKPKWECWGPIAEIHSDNYGRQVWLLVHGILELSEDLEASSASNCPEAMIWYAITFSSFPLSLHMWMQRIPTVQYVDRL